MILVSVEVAKRLWRRAGGGSAGGGSGNFVTGGGTPCADGADSRLRALTVL